MKLISRLLRKADRAWQIVLAHGFRRTGWKMFVSAFHWRRNILLSANEMDLMGRAIRARAGSLLIFGAGHDSILWSILNSPEPTVFLESEQFWLKRIGSQWKVLNIQEVHYTTRRTEMRLLAESAQAPPALDLPGSVRRQKWDTVLVDAPQGWGDGPGRMQSLFEASRLVADDGQIFVHDCDRDDEQYLTARYLRDFDCHRLSHRLWSFQKCSSKTG